MLVPHVLGVPETKCRCVVRTDWLWLTSIFLALVGVHLIVGRLPCTGDEARYAYQGVGLYTSHHFNPMPAQWTRFEAASRCPSIESVSGAQVDRPLQTISTSVVFGPMLVVAGLEGARWLNALLGFAALALLYLLLKRLYPNREGGASFAGIVAICIVAFCVPFVEYLKLLYPETLLFVAATAALYGLVLQRPSIATTAAIFLPFLHIRALPLSLTFMALQNRLRGWLAYAVGIATFAAMQLWLFGSFTGSAFPSYAPSISIFLQRFGMQLYDVRHGAIAYAPLLLIGFAGLIAGAFRRDRACIASLLLLATYFATFMWSTASESWSGRFWVAALPFLAIGICYWLNRAQWWEWLPATPIAALSVMNIVFFALYPLWFLESRQSSIPYAALFLMTNLHFGLLLPVDAEPGGIAAYAQPIAGLLLYTAVVVALLAVSRLARAPQTRAVVCLASTFVVLAPFAFAFAHTIDAPGYRLISSVQKHEIAIHVIDGDTRVDAIQFDEQIPSVWPAPPFPREFLVRCLQGAAVHKTAVMPAHALLIVDRCDATETLDVVGLPLRDSDRFYEHLGTVRLIQRVL
jgi:hypothetical protein